MTTEEAIDILEAYRKIQIKGIEESSGYTRQIRKENLEAFTLAIAALRKVRRENNDY